MKKFIVLLIFFVFMGQAYFSHSVQAQQNNSSSPAGKKQPDSEAKTEDLGPTLSPDNQEGGQNTTCLTGEENKVPLSVAEKRKAKIQAYCGILKRRLEAASQRLKKLGERIKSRLNKMQAEGYDVSPLSDKLLIAESNLTKAGQDILDLEVSLMAMLEQEDYKSSFENVRNSFKAVKENIKSVHASLVEIITEIKATLPKTTPASVSTTITVTPTESITPTKTLIPMQKAQ